MDFEKLLKKAANNQATKQKELETKIKEVKNEKQLTARQELEKKREAKKKLSLYEEDIIKQRLVYHGLASSSGKPLTHVNSPSSSTGKPPKAMKTPSASTATAGKGNITAKTDHLSIPTSRHSQANSNTSKTVKGSKPHPSKPSSTKHNQKPKAKSSSPQPSSLSKKQSVSKSTLSSSRMGVSRNKTPPPGRLKSNKPMPTDFQELLKIAQKNSAKATPTSVSTATGHGSSSSSSIKNGSTPNVGIGRSLLNKNSLKKELNKSTEHALLSTASSSHNEGKSNNTKGKMVANKGQPGMGTKGTQSNGSSSTTKGPQDPSKERAYPYPRPYEGVDRSKLPYSSNGLTRTSNQGGAGLTIQGRGRGVYYRGQNGNMRRRGRGGNAPPKTRNPNKFYTASARLITDNSSGSKGSMIGYRSTWADQMSEYLHNHKDELMMDGDDYDEDEFDDFVVDEGEDGWGRGEGGQEEDYSSAIRSIFGDRYRSSTYDDEDDDIIESSYAQQQFEELRSARIGKKEDEEDLRREREEMERKRKQSKGHTPAIKKTKH